MKEMSDDKKINDEDLRKTSSKDEQKKIYIKNIEPSDQSIGTLLQKIMK